jgi:hypothetical protein
MFKNYIIIGGGIALILFNNALPTIRLFGFDLFSIYFICILGLAVALAYVFIQREFILDSAFFMYILFVAVSLISMSQGEMYPTSSFQIISTIAIVLFVLYFSTDQVRVTVLISTLIFCAIFIMLIAMWEFITGSHLAISRLSNPRFNDSLAATAIFYNRNNLSFFLSLIIPFSVWTGLHGKKVLHDLFYAIISGGMLIVIGLNGSRASIIGSLLGISLVFYVYLKSDESLTNITYFRIGTTTYSLFAIFALFVPLLIENPIPEDRFTSIFIRWQLLEAANSIFWANPLGYGIGNASILISESNINTFGVAAPHSWIIQAALDTGIVGIISFVLMNGLLVDRLMSNEIISDTAWSAPVGASLIVFTVSGFGPSNVLLQTHIYWIIFALGLGILYLSKTNDF